MALSRDRKRILVKGLGTVSVREVETSSAASFSDLGYIKSSAFQDLATMEDIEDETGQLVNSLRKQRVVSLEPILLQTSADEINLLKNAAGKVYAVRHYGRVSDDNRFQYYCMDQAKLYPRVALTFQSGERPLPVIFKSLQQDQLGYDQPLYYFIETNHEIRIADLKLWTAPRIGLNTETTKVLDISGHARHGTLNSDFAAIWQQGTTPAEFLRFDGVNDQLSFGDILDDDASADFAIEFWVRIQTADGTATRIMAKKAVYNDNTAGFSIYRSAGNTLTFRISDGTSSATVATTGTILQNVWKHFKVTVDRNGNATIYLNGAADGTPASVAAIATAQNSSNLYVGRDDAAFGQVDIGGIRIYNYGAGNLPSDIATIVSNHYNAEKAFYNL